MTPSNDNVDEYDGERPEISNEKSNDIFKIKQKIDNGDGTILGKSFIEG